MLFNELYALILLVTYNILFFLKLIFASFELMQSIYVLSMICSIINIANSIH